MLFWCIFNVAIDCLYSFCIDSNIQNNVLNSKLFYKNGEKVSSGYLCILPWKTRTLYSIQVLFHQILLKE